MKKRYVIYILLFFAICLLPSVGCLFGGAQTESSENRTLAELPVLRTQDGWNTDFLSDAGAYFEDHFAFRSQFVTINALLQSRIFGVSVQDTVIVGEDGWLYYQDSLNDYQGVEQMSDRQLFDVAHTMAMVQSYAEEKDVQFALAIAPNKNTLYGEHMPYYYRMFRENGSNIERLEPYLEREEVNYVNLYEVFSQENHTLYHKTDSHWNNEGAVLATDTILTALKVPHPSYEGRSYTVRRDFEGDLETMLYPAAVQAEEEIYYEPEPSFHYVEEVESNYDPRIFTESDASGSLVMYRDSFANALVPYMAECFGSAYFSRGLPYYIADILTYEADTLIIERAERFLPEVAENPPMMAAPLVQTDELQELKFQEIIPDLEIEESGIYTKISGSIPDSLLETESRIILSVDDLLYYEAFPMVREEGEEGFVLYIVSDLLEEDADLKLGITQP